VLRQGNIGIGEGCSILDESTIFQAIPSELDTSNTFLFAMEMTSTFQLLFVFDSRKVSTLG
jgi:hypothetical protein